MFVTLDGNLGAQQPNGTNNPANTMNNDVRQPGAVNPGPGNTVPNMMDMGFGTDMGNVGRFATPADKEFARFTATRSLMINQLSQAALEKSSSDQVKQVARHIADDYGNWTPILQRVSQRTSITLPTEIDPKSRAEINKVAAMPAGPDFDKAWLKEVVRLQNKTLAITQYEANEAGITIFRTWAGQLVPMLQDEIRSAKKGLK